ncbi:hypothetical protein E3N88_11180 [Mikania micrantha]|uniref:Uncharacterized protein n=1 Tax=Mikania micrantha TaxID=192012 RepID=A0A5N6PDU0_9ASTR|nr:hypothetical protein E3N88_11180 [Mikania micrantha]
MNKSFSSSSQPSSGLGHIASRCPNKWVITLTEFEDIVRPCFDEERSQHHAEYEAEIGPDGECLVVCRALNETTFQDEGIQQDAIFVPVALAGFGTAPKTEWVKHRTTDQDLCEAKGDIPIAAIDHSILRLNSFKEGRMITTRVRV